MHRLFILFYFKLTMTIYIYINLSPYRFIPFFKSIFLSFKPHTYILSVSWFISFDYFDLRFSFSWTVFVATCILPAWQNKNTNNRVIDEHFKKTIWVSFLGVGHFLGWVAIWSIYSVEDYFFLTSYFFWNKISLSCFLLQNNIIWSFILI